MIKILIPTLCLTLFAGCVHTTKTSSTENNLDYRTEVTLGKCLRTPGESVLAPAILSALISQGVNRIGASIKKASQKETSISLAKRNAELSNIDFGPCLIVARGSFYRKPYSDKNFDHSKHYTTKKGSGFSYDENDNVILMRNQGLHLASTPDFYFEGSFEKASEHTASSMVVRPLYAYLGKPIAESRLTKNQRNIMLSFAINDGGSSTDFSKGAGASIVIGSMKTGQSKIFPKKPNKNITANQIIRSPHESDWFTLVLQDTPKPKNIQVLVSETRDENKFWEFVGGVFSETKDEITKELQNTLVSSKRDQIEATALSTYDTAYVEAATKLKTCSDKTSQDLKAALEAQNAIKTLLSARNDIGSPRDTLDGTEVSEIKLKYDQNDAEACKTLLGKL